MSFHMHAAPAAPPPPARTGPEPGDIVPDDLLREYEAMPGGGQGMLTEADMALLNMILPDICGELLAYRLREAA